MTIKKHQQIDQTQSQDEETDLQKKHDIQCIKTLEKSAKKIGDFLDENQ
ncbi:MAG: hypothetical protein HFP77_02125 [Methylococcales symbiont of Iophon sp. n. MRB-2018]|nr:MAG: hypothetical protein HFP77_02125 [Methylococcales symbiont of Iophon sp. n. MRB-2018]KAF3980491.1 MAG: hypothetical protein HFP76_01880 [Methylococcales symbiont of Iophon sp. n. MRB-2018]